MSWYDRRAASRYWHRTLWRRCPRRMCVRCLWLGVTGKRRKARRAFRAQADAFLNCGHVNRRPNPKATAVLHLNPEVCLDCGIGIVKHHIRPEETA